MTMFLLAVLLGISIWGIFNTFVPNHKISDEAMCLTIGCILGALILTLDHFYGFCTYLCLQ